MRVVNVCQDHEEGAVVLGQQEDERRLNTDNDYKTEAPSERTKREAHNRKMNR